MGKSILYTVSNGLCTGCGICQGACPNTSITMYVKSGRFLPVVDQKSCKNDKGCHRCYDICPGVGVKLNCIAKEEFSGADTFYNGKIGYYRKCFTGYSNSYNVRYHSASGGMVTQLLVWMLEKKLIDGAAVTAFSSKSELLVHSFIATTKEEILFAKSSKYAPVTLNNIIHDIKAREGTFVIVGLPCHIHGLRKYEKIDKKFKDKVFAYFGLYCSGSKSFYLTEYVLDKYNIDMKGLSYLSYRDEGCLGGMVAKGVDPQSKQSYRFYEDYQKYSHPLRSFFVPRRCLFCIDHFAELADISFGDIHVMPYSLDKVGINSLVTRKSGMTELLYEAAGERAISLSDLNEDVLLSSQIAVKQKKQRASTFIKIDRILGRKVPKYDVKLDDSFVCRSVFSYGFNMLQQFVGNHKSLWSIISVLKKKTTID